jgi:hypothetical protein
MLTKRGFDAVLMMLLSFNLAAGLPRMWARRAVREKGSPIKRTIAGATLHATS